MKTANYKGHLAMLGANILWGLMAPISKSVLSSELVDAISLTTFRLVGAATLFWIASCFTKKEEVSSQDMVRLFFAALLAIVFNQGSYVMGVSLTSPINATIITTTSPIITMIIAALYLKEPITGMKISGLFIGASGALLLILSSNQAIAGSAGNIWGDLLCFMAQFSYSIYFVLFKGLISRYSPVTLMKWMFMYASICCIPFSYDHITAIDFTSLSPTIYWGIIYVVVGGTFIPYFLVPIGQRLLRPTVAIMYNYMQPIVASTVAILWGMDTFGLVKSLAVVLVFSGVYFVTKSKSKAQMETEMEIKKAGSKSGSDTMP
ncbi:DMT family transporter [Massilibacteroides sp.]|uniref:DMT family transporter n=1 Tax=Massilibacteroides sp. TaxID=2034766 RepID=UPI002624B9B6|nr:DMT family transporter [Massilibacteroides sp.]MDD4514082.1 DMT family transporter [Massilibacteroides sp.]